MSKGNGITPTTHESYSASFGEAPPAVQTGKCGPHQISYGGFVDDLSTAQRVIAFAFLTILPPIGWIVLGGVLADCLIFYATHQFSPQKEDMVKKEVPQPQKVGVDESAVQRLPVLPESIKQIKEMWAKQQKIGRPPFSLTHLLMEKGIGFGEPGNSDEANLSKFKEIVDELSQEAQQALAAQLKDIEESKDDDDIEQSTIDDLAPLLFKKNDRDPLNTHQAKYMQNTLNFLIRNRKELFPESESINIPPSPTVAQPEKAMNGGEVSLDQQPGETNEEYVNRLTEKLANVENALPQKVQNVLSEKEAELEQQPGETNEAYNDRLNQRQVRLDEQQSQNPPLKPKELKEFEEIKAEAEKEVELEQQPGETNEAYLNQRQVRLDEQQSQNPPLKPKELKEFEEIKAEAEKEVELEQQPGETNEAYLNQRQVRLDEQQSQNPPLKPKEIQELEEFLKQQSGETHKAYMARLNQRLVLLNEQQLQNVRLKRAKSLKPKELKEFEEIKAEARKHAPIFLVLDREALKQYKGFQGDELFPLGNLQKLLGTISPEKQKVLKKMVDYFEGQEIVTIPEEELRKFSTFLIADVDKKTTGVTSKEEETLAIDADHLLYALILHKKEIQNEFEEIKGVFLVLRGKIFPLENVKELFNSNEEINKNKLADIKSMIGYRIDVVGYLFKQLAVCKPYVKDEDIEDLAPLLFPEELTDSKNVNAEQNKQKMRSIVELLIANREELFSEKG